MHLEKPTELPMRNTLVLNPKPLTWNRWDWGGRTVMAKVTVRTRSQAVLKSHGLRRQHNGVIIFSRTYSATNGNSRKVQQERTNGSQRMRKPRFQTPMIPLRNIFPQC